MPTLKTKSGGAMKTQELDIVAAQEVTDGIFSEDILRNAAAEGVNLFARPPDKKGHQHQRDVHAKQSADAEQSRIDGQLASDFYQRPQWNHSTVVKEGFQKALNEDSASPPLENTKGAIHPSHLLPAQHPSQVAGAAITEREKNKAAAASLNQSGQQLRTIAGVSEDAEKEALKAKFMALDRNGDGYLSYEETMVLLKRLNPGLSDKELNMLFKAADTNGDGKLQFCEFMDFLFTPSTPKPPQEPVKEEKKDRRNTHAMQAALECEHHAAELEKWKAEVLAAYNRRRCQHNASKVLWSEECFKLAEKICTESHHHQHIHVPPQAKENSHIGICMFKSKIGGGSKDPEIAVEAWYGEGAAWDWANPEKAARTTGLQNFAQVLWDGTHSVGMACCEEGKIFVACHMPKGNVPGEYAANVKMLPGKKLPGEDDDEAPKKKQAGDRPPSRSQGAASPRLGRPGSPQNNPGSRGARMGTPRGNQVGKAPSGPRR
eukprot:gnl/MRDRNA2_/MRDRNA2_100898_c0_seq1.p1 gnl/MRDRNA2_/MRDRNA2_100898_c0~~gnl/MRDRNA2_/MRDRNA2_100898_c0_seq1.p1  ORF type:complete len:489 (+),score=106.77 gnl/MRDRNA2_/MRDRNA2_100898_c0_seq1:157-1623(+)